MSRVESTSTVVLGTRQWPVASGQCLLLTTLLAVLACPSVSLLFVLCWRPLRTVLEYSHGETNIEPPTDPRLVGG